MKEVKAKGEKDESVKALGEKGATYTLSRNMSMSAMAEDKENAKGNLSSVHPHLFLSLALSLSHTHTQTHANPLTPLHPNISTLSLKK